MLVLIPREARRDAQGKILINAATDIQSSNSIKAVAIAIAIVIMIEQLPMSFRISTFVALDRLVLIQIAEV